MIKTLTLVLCLFSAVVFVNIAEAKVLPQAQKSGFKSTVNSNTGGSGIGVYPKLRGDRKALVVNFSNLQNATVVSYMLRYKQVSSSGSKTNGQEEGAMGGLNLRGLSSDKAELLFGTCSKNVCRYHSNIKDAKLEVSYTSKTGRKYLKKYRIKV